MFNVSLLYVQLCPLGVAAEEDVLALGLKGNKDQIYARLTKELCLLRVTPARE